MVAYPYWVNSQLAIVPRPRGGDWLEDEMVALKEAGIDVLVSMLEEDETAELLLQDEAIAAQQEGLIFLNFPVKDRSVPENRAAFDSFLTELENYLVMGKCIGVHCRACVGRASVVTASILIRSGVASSDAWQQVEKARRCSVPDTQEQRNWVDTRIRPRTG